MDFKRKVKALRKVLFLPLPLTDLMDVKGANYPEPIIMDSEITLKEIRDIIWHLMADKAPRILGILNRFLRAICIKMIKIFKRIFQVCLNCGYYLKKFQEVNMIILKKLKKADYSKLKVYWLIALLDMLEKVLKTIITKYLNKTAKKNHLLPKY